MEYLPPIELVDEVGHGEEDEERDEAAGEDDILARADVLHHDSFLGDEQSSLLMDALGGGTLVLLQASDEVVVRERVEDAVEDELLARDDAEDVHELLGFVTDEATEDAAVDVGREDGEIDVGVRVGGVEEAEEGHRVGRAPELEDLVDVEQVLVESPVLVPALARSARLQDFQQPREARVDRLVITSQKRPALRNLRRERIRLVVLSHSGKSASRVFDLQKLVCSALQSSHPAHELSSDFIAIAPPTQVQNSNLSNLPRRMQTHQPKFNLVDGTRVEILLQSGERNPQNSKTKTEYPLPSRYASCSNHGTRVQTSDINLTGRRSETQKHNEIPANSNEDRTWWHSPDSDSVHGNTCISSRLVVSRRCRIEAL